MFTIEYRKKVHKYPNDFSVEVQREILIFHRRFTLTYSRPMRQWEQEVT